MSDHVYLPHRAGGRESSINDLATLFSERGWDVTVVCERPKVVKDSIRSGLFPYAILEVDNVFGTIAGLSLWLNPDEIVASVDGRNIPRFLDHFPAGSCLFVRDNQGLDRLTEDCSTSFTFVANSRFTAREVERRVQRPVPVFPPLINLKRYRVSSGREYVTFINPIPKKGLSIALEVAKRVPEAEFLFCEGWPLSEDQWSDLAAKTSGLPNVRLERFTLQMTSIYRRTKILLVPSQCEEAWGRVVTEAQASGIPAIVSDIGGLRESCGVGGVVMPAGATGEAWAETVRGLIADDTSYLALSEAALTQARSYEAHVEEGYIDRFADALADRANLRVGSQPLVQEALRIIESGGQPVREVISVGPGRRIRTAIDATSTLKLFLNQKLYSDAAGFYRRNAKAVENTPEVVRGLAIAFTRIKDYPAAIACWERLLEDANRKLTAFQSKTYADCLRSVGRHEEALGFYLQALEQSASFPGATENALLCAARLGKLDQNQLLAEFVRTNSHSERREWLSSLLYSATGNALLAAEAARKHVENSQSPTVAEYSHAVYVCILAGRTDWALELSAKAGLAFPATYKGPRCAYSTGNGERLEVPVLGSPRRSDSLASEPANANGGRAKLVCSWPGMLAGNRFMDAIHDAFARAGVGFLPIEMPSTCVVGEADVLLIQWPDVLKWRNPNTHGSALQALMFRELSAIKNWKACGVKIVWLVHNSLPHDLKAEHGDELLWQSFFDLIGDCADKFVSLSASAHTVVAEAIPSTTRKPYSYFYHPPYQVRKFSSREIALKRKELGVDEHMKLHAVLGSMGAYKGLKELIQCFREYAYPNVRLVIAGRARDTSTAAMLAETIGDSNQIVLIDRFLPDEEFDLIANCADGIVVPNKRYLNSGALIYAVSTNKPILALKHPFASEMAELVDDNGAMELVDTFADEGAKRFFSDNSVPVCDYNVARLLSRPVVESLTD
ncbi:MAG: glycosyltransferase [Burkholderiaceae bacterium]|nr:glycosyltransferase [Burkholderiaceae bacterium]